jgi:hypothetical protein
MRAARIDANQPQIIAALRKLGVSVQPLHTVGGGVPDLLCGWRGVNVLIEVKDGAKPASARALTADQVTWHRDWRGKVHVVKDVGEALTVLAALGRE